MENGSRNGVHTNHDREQPSKGINGIDPPPQLERPQEKGKPRTEPQQNMTPTSPNLPNGFNGGGPVASQPQSNGTASDGLARLRDLPTEVLHITDGYVPLSKLLTRQAQKTFVGMTTIVQELSQMPLPSSALNGYNSQTATSDDNSEENIHKKLKLLKFLESTHADWAKQLAITEWSRKANIISKLIDLQQHLRTEKQYYNQSIDILCEYKRALLGATLPNPDLRTALEVLSTGKTSHVSEVCLLYNLLMLFN
jgi:mediator of RNA polymerase II transcription subunit 14